jgi:hypothetical protein
MRTIRKEGGLLIGGNGFDGFPSSGNRLLAGEAVQKAASSGTFHSRRKRRRVCKLVPTSAPRRSGRPETEPVPCTAMLWTSSLPPHKISSLPYLRSDLLGVLDHERAEGADGTQNNQKRVPPARWFAGWLKRKAQGSGGRAASAHGKEATGLPKLLSHQALRPGCRPVTRRPRTLREFS